MSSRMKIKQQRRWLRKLTAIPAGREKSFRGMQMERWSHDLITRLQRTSKRRQHILKNWNKEG